MREVLGLSIIVTVSNEYKELQRLLYRILSMDFGVLDYEIIIQINSSPRISSGDRHKVLEVASQAYPCNVSVVTFTFEDDFSAMKNNAHKACKHPWILQLDADELPTQGLMMYILSFLISNSDNLDAVAIPRANVVIGLQQSDIDEWKWKANAPDHTIAVNVPVVDTKEVGTTSGMLTVGPDNTLAIPSTAQLINWPDYQIRLYRNNHEVYWEGKVHEKLNVDQSRLACFSVPPSQGVYLTHVKSIHRQRQQNQYYETL